LFVERPEVFERSAAAREDDDLYARHSRQLTQSLRDLGGGAVALHAGRADDDVHVRVASAQDLDDIAHGGAVERRDDADFPRQERQRTLALGSEQAFGFELVLQLLERHLELPEAARLQHLADELILALRFVRADSRARDDVLAVLRLEAQITHSRAKHHCLDLRSAVLQREVQMARVPDLHVGQLAFDPDVDERFFEQLPDVRVELADAQHAPHRFRGRWGGRGWRRWRTRWRRGC